MWWEFLCVCFACVCLFVLPPPILTVMGPNDAFGSNDESDTQE